MINQSLRNGAAALADPLAVPVTGTGGVVRPLADPFVIAEAQGGALAQRIVRAMATGRRGAGPAPIVLPSELVTALIVDLPRTSARGRAALLAFAVEERVGVPIEGVVVAPAPLGDPAAPPTAHLALVVSREALAAAEAGAPGARGAAILPDFLGLPRPEARDGAPVWSVWREGARAVVRRSDGTGFAAATDALGLLWARAGRPTLLSLGPALPAGLPAADLSEAPPDPDPRDLAFSFRSAGRTEAAAAARRPLAAAAVIALAALALHLALAAVDAAALGRIVATERAAAESALGPVLPGVALGPDPAAILSRLAPTAPEERRSGFLPLLAEASAAMAATGRPVTLRGLAWGAEDGVLSLRAEAAELDDLQAVERALREAGLSVASGAASAGEGGAEVEMRVAREAAG